MIRLFGFGGGAAYGKLGHHGKREFGVFGIGSSLFGHYTRFIHYDFGDGF